MKKLLLSLIVAFVAAPMMLLAQNSSIEDIYNEYAGEEGITAVNITKEMFTFLAQMNIDTEDADFKDIQKAISGLNGIKILTISKSLGKTKEEIDAKIKSKLEKEKFTELMTVKEAGTDARFLLRKKGDDIVELLLVSNERNETTIMSFFGIIDLASISKISKGIKIKGLDNLDKINQQQ